MDNIWLIYGIPLNKRKFEEYKFQENQVNQVHQGQMVLHPQSC